MTKARSHSLKDAAEILGVSHAHLKNLIKKGEGPQTYKLGRRTLVSEGAMEKFVKKKEQGFLREDDPYIGMTPKK
jgi:excisionase family DNA binding protein